jgi:anti-sigma B factor antagonist
LLELTARAPHGCVIVEVRGEADLCSAPALDQYLSDVLTRHASAIVLDLSHLTFADCAAMRVLLDAEWRAASQGRPFVLAAPQPAFTRLLQITGFDRHFTVFPAVAEAADAIRKRRSPATPNTRGITSSANGEQMETR